MLTVCGLIGHNIHPTGLGDCWGAEDHNCSTLNYNSIEPNEDIRYYIAITTKERIFHHNKPPVMSDLNIYRIGYINLEI